MITLHDDRRSFAGVSISVRKRRWHELCGRYLPVKQADSIWRYSRDHRPGDPDQGWKLHLTATILNAGRVLQAVAPFLHEHGVLYKAPISLSELDKLNSGIFYGYSQVGKFVTIYPQTTEEAVFLGKELHQRTQRFQAPSIPFDARYGQDGLVYYRYGAFKTLQTENHLGKSVYAVRDPAGNLVEDRRDSEFKPDWVSDPFVSEPAFASRFGPTPLQTTFRAFRALSQRGKGGVYQAINLSEPGPRLCILKEGRKNGETDWYGRDGFWRIKHERRVLTQLHQQGIQVPQVYAAFTADNNYFLAAEFIEGIDLRSWLERKQRRISIKTALKRGAELGHIVSCINTAGWVWRDCKPGNVVITKAGELRPLDFEGACQVNNPDPLPWGTAAYIAPEATASFKGDSRLPEDLYALGAVIYYLLTGRPPDIKTPEPPARLRKGIPREAEQVVMNLLHHDPSRRSSAHEAAAKLEALCK